MIEQSSFERFIGVVLGNYRLERLVEQDRWGAVFLASTNAETTSVIRLLGAPPVEKHLELSPDARIVYLGRFQQEANQVSRLQHSHILPLLEYGNYRGLPYLVYPDVSRMSLRTLLAQSAPTDLRTVGHYLEQIGSALEYAHNRATLHRNLSTNCIFVLKNGQLVIGEFGLMRMIELNKQSSQSDPHQESTFEGSSESSSPEQLLGKSIDTYTDIYAMGAVLYRLLSGHPPFSGHTREEITRQHLYAQVPSLSIWRPDLPVDLDHIIAKAMSKEPPQRFHQPSDLVEAYYQIVAPGERPRILSTTSKMEALVASQWTPNPASASLPRIKATKKPKASRRRFISLVGAGGGVVVLAASAVFGANFLKRTFANTLAALPPAAPSVQPTAGKSAITQGKTILARVANVPINSAQTFPVGSHPRRGLLIHLPDNQFVAFDSTCTHAGCAVDYSQQTHMLVCPCHGAIFDPAHNAAVLQGPATTPLAPIKIVVNADGTVTAE